MGEKNGFKAEMGYFVDFADTESYQKMLVLDGLPAQFVYTKELFAARSGGR